MSKQMPLRLLLPLALLFWVAVALGVAPGGRASEP